MPTTEKKSTLTAKVIDFSNVKEGGGSFNKKRVRAGDYLAKITKVEDAPAKGDGVHQYLFTLKLQKYSQYGYPYYCKLQENQLWKLRNLLIAAGINVPKKRVKLDPSKVVGKLIGVTMEDDEYEGKMQSTVAAIFPASELGDGDLADEGDTGVDDDGDDSDDEDLSDVADDDEGEAEEEPDEDEAEEEDEGDQFDSMDRTQLKAYLKAQDASFVAKKSQTDDDLRELARAASGDDDEEEEAEEEPEPEPAPKKKAKKKAAKPATDEMEELDLDDL